MNQKHDDHFHVEQAIFTSSNRGTVKGYQLVAKSSGIDRTTEQALSRWSPSQAPAGGSDAWTINGFQVNDDWHAVTRTMMGGPEYSNRGGMQVVTRIVLLDRDQYECYQNNAISVAKTAMAMGSLYLPNNEPYGELPPISLPRRPLDVWKPFAHSKELLEKVTQLLSERQRVAMVGFPEVLEFVNSLLQGLSGRIQREFSFSTGLIPSLRRPFQLHCLPSANVALRRSLDSQEIHRIHF